MKDKKNSFGPSGKTTEPRRWKGIKLFIEAAGALLCLLVLVGIVQFILQPKWTNNTNMYARVKLFYREDPSPDVVFIGSSHVYCGVNTLELFQEYGISSYDFSASSQSMELTTFAVQEAIRAQKPKLVVIDPMYLAYLIARESHSRQWLDATPPSVQKASTVQEMLTHNEQFETGLSLDSLLSYVFPLLRYHDRWESLVADDFALDPDEKYYHGAVHYHGYGPHYPSAEADLSRYGDTVVFNDEIVAEAKRYFEKDVELCKENDVKLLLMKVPSPAWRQDIFDLISAWAEEYEVPFIDFNEYIDELGINVKTDFLDAAHHLNDAGATKLSDGIGEYLTEHYDLTDHRGDPAYGAWDYDWQIYQQDKASYFLSVETDWAGYLEKLRDPNYTVFIAARGNTGGEVHPELTDGLKQLGLTVDLGVPERVGGGGI